MKKLLTFFALLCISISAFSQIQIGIKGGGNFSYVTSETPAGAIGLDWEALSSYHIGGFVQSNLNDRLSFRGELLYSFEGAELEDIALDIQYLNLPLLLRFQLFSGIYLDLGVEPGLVISSNDNIIFDKNAEIGGLIGAGVGIGERLGVFARYVHGLSDVYEGIILTDENGNAVGEGRGKDRLWQIGAEFYLFK